VAQPTGEASTLAQPAVTTAPVNNVASPSMAATSTKPRVAQPEAREIEAGSLKPLGTESSAPAMSFAIDAPTAIPSVGSALVGSSTNVALKREGGGVRGPSVRVNPKPTYPPIARDTGISGAVVLKVQVDEYGQPTKVEIISGHPALATPTQSFVRSRWRYNPATIDGRPVPGETEVRLNFHR
jgi:TonB family protein